MFCRARRDDRAGCCLKFPTDSDIVATDNNQQKKMFSFDKVYDPNSTQEQVNILMAVVPCKESHEIREIIQSYPEASDLRPFQCHLTRNTIFVLARC